MWRMILVPLSGVLVASCATTSRLHDGQTTLASSESAAAAASAHKVGGDGFRRLWRSPTFKPWRLLKWDENHSTAASGSPTTLLQSIREEVGRVNQRPTSGDDLFLTCTVYLYCGGGWFSDPKAHYELVARDKAGKAQWVADDEVTARLDLARSLADSEEAIIAREIARKIRQAFGL